MSYLVVVQILQVVSIEKQPIYFQSPSVLSTRKSSRSRLLCLELQVFSHNSFEQDHELYLLQFFHVFFVLNGIFINMLYAVRL